jgi:hypothetical protein
MKSLLSVLRREAAPGAFKVLTLRSKNNIMRALSNTVFDLMPPFSGIIRHGGATFGVSFRPVTGVVEALETRPG